MAEAGEAFDDVGADGGDGAVTPDQLAALKGAAEEWNARAEAFWQKRAALERARFCVWDGQGDDGRLWSENAGGIEPEPFDGCSDSRVRWADALVREKERTLLVAMMRAVPRCEGRGRGDERRAQRATALLRWMVDRMGVEWARQWKALLNYAWGDSPAIAMMGVEWAREYSVETEELDAGALAQLWMERYGQEDADAATAAGDFAAALTAGAAGEEELAGMVLDFFPELRPARARRIVREIRTRGKAEFPSPKLCYEGPRIRAMRYGDDFIIPDNAMDFHMASPWFVTEWLTRPALLERRDAQGWDKQFVEDVLANEGVPALRRDLDGQNTVQGGAAVTGPDRYKGLFQVLRVYWIAADTDGNPGRYESVIHPASERTAYGRRLARGARGRWPAVLYQSEVVDGYLLNARGIPELVAPAQGVMKSLLDTAADAARIWDLPPILSHGVDGSSDGYFWPLKVIKGKRDMRLEPMKGPQPTTQGELVVKRLERMRDWIHGRASAEDADGGQWAAVNREEEVVWFLGHVREVCGLMLQLAVENASDELLARITDATGAGIGTREEIQGEYDVRLVFDPSDLDFERMKDRLAMVRDSLMAMDRSQRIDAGVFVGAAFRSVFPYMADDVLREQERSEEDELREEAKNYALLRAGVLPTLDVEGNWNYQLRRQWYDELAQANPTVFDDMGPDKRELLQRWLQGLEQQATQFGANVQVGRTGMPAAEPAERTQANNARPQ